MDATRLIRATACAPAEVRAILAAGWSVKTDTSGGRESLDDLLQLGQTFKILDETGTVRAAYILQTIGGELWVVLGAGRADLDLTAVGLALIEAQGRAFDSIGFVTRRRGLVKKAQAIGYQVTGKTGDVYTLRKALR